MESIKEKIPNASEGNLEFDTSIEHDDGAIVSQHKSSRVDANGNVDQVLV